MTEGMSAVFGGMWFIVVTPRVWGYALVPALVLVILGCGLGALGYWGALSITDAVMGEPDGFWGHLGAWTLFIMLTLAALLTALLLALVLAQPLSGFALEAVCYAQERALIGRNMPHASFLTALWISTWATLVMLVVGGTANAALFLVAFLFPPAAVFTAPLQFIIGGWLLAWNFLDYPLSLRGLGLIARLRWSACHFLEFTVFGVLWAALLFVPGLFFLILPMGVAGATRLVVMAEQETGGPLEERDDVPMQLEPTDRTSP